MSFFCLLWIPLFHFFRRSLSIKTSGKSGWALFFGCAIVLFQFFLGSLVTPSGFGLSRWVSGFVDIVSLPVLVPIIICVLCIAARVFPANMDIAGFTLVSLIPAAAFRSAAWISPYSPILLVIVPLLWTAQAVGISFYISCILRYPRWYVVIASILGTIAMPLIAATAWWAFFVHQDLIGFMLIFTSLVPVLISLILDILGAKRERGG